MNIFKQIRKLFQPRISNGVKGELLTGNEFDYSAIASVNPDTLPDINNGTILEFNQGEYEETAEACTIVNSTRSLLRLVSSVRGYQPKVQDIFDSVDFAKTQGYSVGQGWYVTFAIDSVRKRWNTNHPDMQVTSYKILGTDIDFPKIKLKGYLMIGSYSGNEAYNDDFRADAVLDGASFGEPTYGHCTLQQVGPSVNDSYAGNFYNVYKEMQFDELIKNNVWSNQFYFFAPAHTKADDIKKNQSIINECTKQINSANILITTSTDNEFINKQKQLIIDDNAKIQDAKNELNNL